jgi:hypothetical protein
MDTIYFTLGPGTLQQQRTLILVTIVLAPTRAQVTMLVNLQERLAALCRDLAWKDVADLYTVYRPCWQHPVAHAKNHEHIPSRGL